MNAKWRLPGTVFLAVGVVEALLVHAHPEKMRAPAWLVYGLCAIFALVGAGMLLESRGIKTRPIGAIVFTFFTAMAGWFALRPPNGGMRMGPLSVGGTWTSWPGRAAAWICCLAMGVGAAMSWADVLRRRTESRSKRG